MRLNHQLKKSTALQLIFSLLFISGALFLPKTIVEAQETPASISLESIDGTSFPEMTLFFEVRNTQGKMIPDLIPQEIQVFEGGNPNAVKAVALEDPGLQIIVAINPAPSMAIYYGGITRYEQIRIALTKWAATLSTTNDDFSLVTTNGILATRLNNGKSWAELFQQFKPAFLSSVPSLASLTQALDLAADTNPREHMKRAILYITPLPPAGELNALPDLASRAEQLGARVFIWLIGPSYAGETVEAGGLRQLAVQTGGSLFVFSGAEQLPDPETHFHTLRGIYRLQYSSSINQSGNHLISVSINHPDSSLVSNELAFEITVTAPNLVLINPPREILREEKRVSPQGEIRLLPLNHVIQFMAEFPDGHPRPLSVSRLFVDSKLTAENLVSPYEQLTWDLDEFDESGIHNVRVEVEDSLGLSSSTLETPVILTVSGQSKAAAAALTDRLAILFAVLIAGAALVLMLIFAGRRNLFTSRRAKSKEYQDPVTQPVIIQQEGRVNQNNASSEPGSKPRYPARLIQVGEDNQPLPNGGVIPLEKQEYIFGSDRRSAGIVLDSPSVDAIHAKLIRSEEGDFHLSDLGSVAGTWVNFAPVSSSGIHLEHADLIHIGKISFRFELTQPPPAKKPVITRLPTP